MAPQNGFVDWERQVEGQSRSLLIGILPRALREPAARHPLLVSLLLNALIALSLLAVFAAVSAPGDEVSASLQADLRKS